MIPDNFKDLKEFLNQKGPNLIGNKETGYNLYVMELMEEYADFKMKRIRFGPFKPAIMGAIHYDVEGNITKIVDNIHIKETDTLYELWKYLYDQHNLLLVNDELFEIIERVKLIIQENERLSDNEL